MKVDSGSVAQEAVGKGEKGPGVRMPNLNLDQIDRIMRTEEGPDALSLKPNLKLSRLIQQSQLAGFRVEQGEQAEVG